MAANAPERQPNGQESETVRQRRWASPPLDRRVGIVPANGRARSAAAVVGHIEQELIEGRSLYCIVRDAFVDERIDEFDGRALPSGCRRGVSG